MTAQGDFVDLTLLCGFEIRSQGELLSVPHGAERLIAYLALQHNRIPRIVATEKLWPHSSHARATANLRSALWKGRQVAEQEIIEIEGSRLGLAPAVRVDLHEAVAGGQAIAQEEGPLLGSGWESVVEALSEPLLPAWHDDWLTLEREQWDQLRLHALEDIACRLRAGNRYLAALQTVMIAVAVEPLRETPHRIAIETHLAEGNIGSALKHYQGFRALLQRDLGVAPSAHMVKLAKALFP